MAYWSFVDFSTNSTNPYYLHPNENPTLVIVSPSLDDKNYHIWAQSMQIVLISKNKDKCIDKTLTKPPLSDTLYAPWIRCNIMIFKKIFTDSTKIQLSRGNPTGKPGHNNSKGKFQGVSGPRGHNRVCRHCGRTNHVINLLLQTWISPRFQRQEKISGHWYQFLNSYYSHSCI